ELLEALTHQAAAAVADLDAELLRDGVQLGGADAKALRQHLLEAARAEPQLVAAAQQGGSTTAQRTHDPAARVADDVGRHAEAAQLECHLLERLGVAPDRLAALTLRRRLAEQA